MDWNPVETAPLDGSLMLVKFIGGQRHIASWAPHRDASYPFVWKNEYGDILVRPWKSDDGPTHWMPLP